MKRNLEVIGDDHELIGWIVGAVGHGFAASLIEGVRGAGRMRRLGSVRVLASLHLSLAAMVDSFEEISESFVIMLLPMGWAKTTRSLKLSRVVPSRRKRATSSFFNSRL